MNYLSDYINERQPAILKKHGAFYAFSQKQLDDKKVNDVKYVSLGMGLIAPKDNCKDLNLEINELYKKGIQQDISENGISKIIHRELANHECQISGDYQDVIDLMSDYGVTPDQVHTEYSIFYDHCVANEYF